MLSLKDGKAMKPLYDYYVETDLDTIDDQPIDFSKRYDDQLADDVCGLSSRKKRHLSTPSENVVPNKIPGDELKVYCIEGTPLLISSASSLCDLHEIGALLQNSENGPSKDDSEQKPCFQEPYSNPIEGDSPHTKCDELLEDSTCDQVQIESKEDTTQENTSSRADETFSKASSPLMFSRSSSICSLNSFEQHSIVDDRSSVSMFSNLASGIISPSEIPDSPGEAMSPFIHKRQSEFVFPPNNPQPKSMDPVLANLKMNPTPQFTDQVFEEDNLKVYNDEGDCSSVSNLSALSIQTSSMNRVSVAVFHKSSFPVVEHKSAIRISCSIMTGNAELQSIEEAEVKETVARNGAEAFGGYGKEDCMMEDDDEDQDEKINFSRLVEEEEDCKDGAGSPDGSFSFEEGFDARSGSFEKPVEKSNFLPENESPDYSKENSEDEDSDALLEECIKRGMPTRDESLQQLSKQQSNNTCDSNQESKSKGDIEEDCDPSDSDEEDLLLQSCIQLGMPQKTPNKEANDSLNSSKTPQNFSKVENMTEVSDDEDYGPLLQHLIELGKPKNDPKESCHDNAMVSNSYATGCLDLGYRDNRPDGISEEEDDNILNDCIHAGMPKPKVDESKRLYSLPLKSPSMKSQSHFYRLSPTSSNRAEYMSSFTGPHQALRKSPTAEYRTANSKPNQQRKSPTKEGKAMLLPSYNKMHQRQPHKRSPSAEDRMLPSSPGLHHCSGGPTSVLSSLGVRQLQSRRKFPAKMLLPPYGGQHRRSPVVSEKKLFSNPRNQQTMSAMVSSNQGNQPTTFSSSGNQLTMFSNPGNQPKMFSNPGNHLKRIPSPPNDNFQKKYQCWIQDFRDPKIDPAPIPDATCTYRTEDTPILSPSASVSDLSTLSFSEDRMYLDCSLNNSRNSDCSSESEEDELLRQCIRLGMPNEKRALA